MKPEFPTLDQDKTAAPREQAVEFALILSRMINTVKDDPSQMRLAIYEFARARLKTDTSWADETERTQLLTALETAIRGVEQFSTVRDDQYRLQSPTQSAQIAPSSSQDEPPARSVVEVHRPEPAPRTVPADGTYSWAHRLPGSRSSSQRAAICAGPELEQNSAIRCCGELGNLHDPTTDFYIAWRQGSVGGSKACSAPACFSSATTRGSRPEGRGCVHAVVSAAQ